MMKRVLRIGMFVLGAVVFLGGCAQTKETLGLTKRAPDEFAVYSRDPLALPAEFALRKPTPGIDRPQLITPQDKVLRAMMGRRAVMVQQAQKKPASPGTGSFLAELGTDVAQPGIRETVAVETVRLAEEDVTWGDVINFWGTKAEYGSVVDAQLEVKRIQENRALGRALNVGVVPVVDAKRRALLEGIF